MNNSNACSLSIKELDKVSKQKELTAINTGRDIEPYNEKQDYLQYIDGKPRYDGVQSLLESRDIHIPYGSPEDSPDKETICGLGNN